MREIEIEIKGDEPEVVLRLAPAGSMIMAFYDTWTNPSHVYDRGDHTVIGPKEHFQRILDVYVQHPDGEEHGLDWSELSQWSDAHDWIMSKCVEQTEDRR
jgi:hypothetical protein